MPQRPLSYLDGLLPTLALVTSGANVPVPLCTFVLAPGYAISDMQVVIATEGLSLTPITAALDGNLRDSDPAVVAFRTSGLSGSLLRLWFTPPVSSQFEFAVLVYLNGGGETGAEWVAAPTEFVAGEEILGTTVFWSFSSGVQAVLPPTQPLYFTSGLPSTTDTNGVTWFLAPVYPATDPSTTITVEEDTSSGSSTAISTAVCVVATFEVSGGIAAAFSPTNPVISQMPYAVDVWEVETSGICKDDLYVVQTPSASNSSGATTVTVFVNQAAASSRDGARFIRAFIALQDATGRCATVPLIVVCLAPPAMVIRPTPAIIVAAENTWLCAIPAITESVQLLECGWDTAAETTNQVPLSVDGLVSLGFEAGAATTTAILASAFTSGDPSLISSFDSSFVSSTGETSSELASSWSNLSLVEPGLGGSSDSSSSSGAFLGVFGLVYTNNDGRPADAFPFPLSSAIQLGEFGRVFQLAAEELASSALASSLVPTQTLEFRLDVPLASTGPDGLSSNNLSSAGSGWLGWPTVTTTASSTGGEPGYYFATEAAGGESSGTQPLWIGVTSTNLPRLVLSWEVAGGFSPLAVSVTTTENPADTVSTSYLTNVSVTLTNSTGPTTAPQVTAIQGEPVVSTVDVSETPSVTNIWLSTSAGITASHTGTTTLTVGGLTWPAGTDLAHLTTSLAGGTTAFVPVTLHLAVTDALGATFLYGQANLRVFADEVPYADSRLLAGIYNIVFLNVASAYVFSSSPAANIIIPFTKLVCGGMWETPADAGVTLTLQSSSESSYPLVSDGFQISAAGNLVAAQDIQGGSSGAVLSREDLAGTRTSAEVQLTYSTTWTPARIIFEPLFEGASPSTHIDTGRNYLYMFPGSDGNFAWPVPGLWSYPELPGTTWRGYGVAPTPIGPFTPSSGDLPFGAFGFRVTVANSWLFTPTGHLQSGGTWNMNTSTYPIPSFYNNVRCTLKNRLGGSDVLLSDQPTDAASGEIVLNAFAPLGAETNTWIYDPTGFIQVPTDVPTTSTIRLVVVDANAAATSSGMPSSTPTTDTGVGFYNTSGAFVGASVTLTWSSGQWRYGGSHLLSTLAALAFAPFGFSQPPFESTSGSSYLLRVFASVSVQVTVPVAYHALIPNFMFSVETEVGGTSCVFVWSNLTVDPRTSSPSELFQPSAFEMTGFNAGGIFGYEMMLQTFPTSLHSGSGLAGSDALSTSLQRYSTSSTGSLEGEPSEAFQCPDSVCFNLVPDSYLTEVDGFLAFSLEATWDQGMTWYILARNENANMIGNGRADTGINGSLAGPWPERYIPSLCADGSIPPWGASTQTLQYRLGLQTQYGLAVLSQGFVYTNTLSASDWRFHTVGGDFTPVNTQFRDFHLPTPAMQLATFRVGVGDLGAVNAVTYEAAQLSAPLLSGEPNVVLYFFKMVTTLDAE